MYIRNMKKEKEEVKKKKKKKKKIAKPEFCILYKLLTNPLLRLWLVFFYFHLLQHLVDVSVRLQSDPLNISFQLNSFFLR